MAGRIILDDGGRTFDNNGDPRSGAKIKAFLAGTSTPASLYTTRALSVAHSNPVVADANGFFAQMWADEGTLLDVKTYAADDTSYDTPLRTFLNVTPQGSAGLGKMVFADDYASLALAYAAIPSTGGAVIVPANYTETLSASITMSKPFAGFLFLGPATITMGTNQVIVSQGTTGAFIATLGALSGGDRNGALSIGGVNWIYTGNAAAFDIGGTTTDTEKLNIDGQLIYTAGGGTSANAIRLRQVTFSRITNCTLRGTSTQTAGGLLMDGSGSDSNYCGFNDFTGTVINSFGKGIRLLTQCNFNTGTAMCINGPLSSGSIGIDFQGIAVGNEFQGQIATWESGVNFADSANVYHNTVRGYMEGNTNDYVTGAAAVRNTVVSLGEVITGTDATGNSTTNVYLSGAEASRLFLSNSGPLATKTAAGLVMRMLMLDASDDVLFGGIDRTIGTIRMRSNGTDNATLSNVGVFSTKGKIYPAADEGAIQTACGVMAGSGAPDDANGANGDFYFRSDGTGGANTAIYHKEGGTWVALTTA